MSSRWHLFETGLKWMAGVWVDEHLSRLVFGQPDPQRAAAKLGVQADWQERESPGMKRARKLLSRFARGEAVDLALIPVDLGSRTSFQRKILTACRQIGWGSTVSYGQLAARCGSPRAARAVGSVMRSNRQPLVIPCHRVIAANGRLGGYSAHDGLATKQALLKREGVPLLPC